MSGAEPRAAHRTLGPLLLGLNVLDFMKRTTLLKCSPEALRAIGPAAASLGDAEGLQAHARSVTIRLN